MNIYCVYLTTYSGNKLPPFYIGSTSTKKIYEGYRGSVWSKNYKQIWKTELTNSPHLFKTKIIKEFKTREQAYDYEEKLHNQLNVVDSPMYINLVTAKAKFSSHGKKLNEEHKKKISESEKGKIVSEETKIKQSLSHLGKSSGMKGKTHSFATRNRLSEIIKTIDYGSNECSVCGRVGKSPSIWKHIKKCKTLI